MRDIKFRGKDILHKSWQYGSLAKDEPQKAYYIIDNEYGRGIDVDENTIGQYTGLKDKNGKEIYEGDILLAPAWFGSLKCICIYQQENQVSSIQGFGLYSYDTYFQKYRTLVESDEWDEFEVIGNVWEDSDLLNDSKNTKINKV